MRGRITHANDVVSLISNGQCGLLRGQPHTGISKAKPRTYKILQKEILGIYRYYLKPFPPGQSKEIKMQNL